MSKISQKQMVFYKLYQEYKKDKSRYVPAWEFVGEMHIPEFNEWVLMSYKCPTRLTDLFQENPSLLERVLIVGKSGAEYYGYRIRSGVDQSDLKDKSLLNFYQVIKQYKS